jgi:hypothetical protein
VETSLTKTPRPAIAGILVIVTGAIKLSASVGTMLTTYLIPVNGDVRQFVIDEVGLILLISIPLVLSILAIVGGTYSLRRRRFGVTVTGSIAAFLPTYFVLATLLPLSILGLTSIILIALSKDEFE